MPISDDRIIMPVYSDKMQELVNDVDLSMETDANNVLMARTWNMQTEA